MATCSPIPTLIVEKEQIVITLKSTRKKKSLPVHSKLKGICYIEKGARKKKKKTYAANPPSLTKLWGPNEMYWSNVRTCIVIMFWRVLFPLVGLDNQMHNNHPNTTPSTTNLCWPNKMYQSNVMTYCTYIRRLQLCNIFTFYLYCHNLQKIFEIINKCSKISLKGLTWDYSPGTQ